MHRRSKTCWHYKDLSSIAAKLAANCPPGIRTRQRRSPVRIRPVSWISLSSVDSTSAQTRSAFRYECAHSQPVGRRSSASIRSSETTTGQKLWECVMRLIFHCFIFYAWQEAGEQIRFGGPDKSKSEIVAVLFSPL